MVKLRGSARRNTVVLRLARRRYPFKLVLIDGTHLILQLQEYAPDGRALRLWGELQLSDPGGRLTSAFTEIWDDIDNDDATRNVVATDLPPMPAKDSQPAIPVQGTGESVT